MLDSETVIRSPHDATVARKGGKKHVEIHDPRTSVTVRLDGCDLVLFFDDAGRHGPLREVRLLPAADELEPGVLRRLVPQVPLYLAYARAAMSADEENWVGTIEALRTIGRPGRGLTPEFYKVVATNYAALIAEGEPHPVKALAAMHHVSISAASRWITEAKRRKLITT